MTRGNLPKISASESGKKKRVARTGQNDEIEDTIEAIAIDLDGLLSQTIQEENPL